MVFQVINNKQLSYSSLCIHIYFFIVSLLSNIVYPNSSPPRFASPRLINDYVTLAAQLPRTPPSSPALSGSASHHLSMVSSYRADFRFDILRNYSIGPSGMTAEEAELLGLVITAHQPQHFDELAKRLKQWPSNPPHTIVFIAEVTGK